MWNPFKRTKKFKGEQRVIIAECLTFFPGRDLPEKEEVLSAIRRRLVYEIADKLLANGYIEFKLRKNPTHPSNAMSANVIVIKRK